MKKTFYFPAIAILVGLLAAQSCNTQVADNEEPVKIENTLKSVSFLQDTVGLDPAVLREVFTLVNEAIDEIGYPDAGYISWMRESDTSGVRFMIEGSWPDKAAYDLIHDHQLYIDAMNDIVQDGLVTVKYYRFEKVK